MDTLYANHFQLREAAFSIAPNPRFLFMSEQHREALAHLLYGIEHGSGFVLLTGEVGTGKTTLCRCLLEKIPADVDVAFIINPRLTVVELLANICDELNIGYPSDTQSNRTLIDAINHYLLAKHAEGRKTVLIIDEAQNLDGDVLEQLRLLTNLETDECKLLQIILLGQPELQHKLAQPELRQLSQRITARYHLQALSQYEISAYITHRLSVAGCNEPIFNAAAERYIHHISQGIPRLINLICDRAMLGAYAKSVKNIDRAMTRQASREVLGQNTAQTNRNRRNAAVSWAALAVAMLLIAVFVLDEDLLPPPAQQETVSVVIKHEIPQPEPKPIPRPVKTVVDNKQPEQAWAWPENVGITQSRTLAFRALFAAWGMVMPDSVKPCDYAVSEGFACLRQIGDLGRLRSLNRPVVLPWQNDAGEIVNIAVISLDGATAKVVLGGKQVQIPLTVLRQHWMETFTLLWRTPEAYSGDILPGTVGPSAKWLNQRLAELDPSLSKQSISGIYQGRWVHRVRQFQRETGLPPNGAAGPQTLIRLTTALHAPGPRLLPEPEIHTSTHAETNPTNKKPVAGSNHVLHP